MYCLWLAGEYLVRKNNYLQAENKTLQKLDSIAFLLQTSHIQNEQYLLCSSCASISISQWVQSWLAEFLLFSLNSLKYVPIVTLPSYICIQMTSAC